VARPRQLDARSGAPLGLVLTSCDWAKLRTRFDAPSRAASIEPLNGAHSHVLDADCAHSIAAIGLP